MIIGITGPIASGKDSVISILSSNASIIIDADRIGKYLVEENLNKISKIFSLENLSFVNLTPLSNFVFNDFDSFLNYNRFIHPILVEKLRKIMLEMQKIRKNDIIILNCALLFSFKLDFYCDKILFIDAEKELRIQRLMLRNNIKKEEAIKRIEFQEKFENYQRIRSFFNENQIEILKMYYIKNDGTSSDLEKKIYLLLQRFGL